MRCEHGGGQDRLADYLLDGAGGEELGYPVQREAVLRAERKQDRVITGSGLQFEVEGHAEALAQREAKCPVQPGAERRVADKLHAAGVVEEPLQHNGVHRGQHAQLSQARGQVGHDYFCCRVADPAFPGQPAGRLCGAAGGKPAGYAGPDRADFFRQFRCPAGRLAEPERYRWRRTVRVSHPHDAGLHSQDPPRCGAEQEHVARHALDRPVFVDCADRDVVGLGHHPVVTEFGDCAPGCQRREPGPAPAA